MQLQIRKLTRQGRRLRMALIGPTGSGKTLSAMRIADGLAAGGNVLIIETEQNSSGLYDSQVESHFDQLELPDHNPETFVEALRLAAKGGYAVVIIDSLSHAWMGKGGALEQVDEAAKRSRSGNSFTAWREVTPMHNRLVDAMLQAPFHLIATMRAKTEYVLEEGPGGKKTPRKIGLAAVQRDGIEYEFDLCADIDFEHNFIVSKSRFHELTDRVVKKAGQDLGEEIRGYLEQGGAIPEPAQPKAAAPAPAGTVPPEAAWLRDQLAFSGAQYKAFRATCKESGVDWTEVVAKFQQQKLTAAEYDDQVLAQVIQALQQGEVDEFAEDESEPAEVAEVAAEEADPDPAPEPEEEPDAFAAIPSATEDRQISDLFAPALAKRLVELGSTYVQAKALKDCGVKSSEIQKQLSAGAKTMEDLLARCSPQEAAV